MEARQTRGLRHRGAERLLQRAPSRRFTRPRSGGVGTYVCSDSTLERIFSIFLIFLLIVF